MLRKHFSILVLSLGTLCLAGSVAATTLTSSNSLDTVGYAFGQTTSVYTGWAATLIGGVLGEGSGFTAYPSFTAGGQVFDIAGYTGSPGGAYQGSTSYPMILTMPNLASFTGLELAVNGSPTITLTLSDGSTVTNGALSFGSTMNFVTFISPLQIISAEIDSSGDATSLYDVSWGTANLADLPTQPQQGGGGGDDTSATPEGSTLWLMGSGLLGLSQLFRKRKHLLS
jgi:hypothetical protein